MRNIDDNHPLMKAAYALSAPEPATAWDVEDYLSGVILGDGAVWEAVSEYIDSLDEIGVDPNITTILRRSLEPSNEARTALRHGLQLFLNMYASLMKSGEQDGFKVPTAPGFWEKNK